MFIEFLNMYGMEILHALALAFVGWLGVVAKQLATRYINTDAKRAVAKTAVMAVEQLCKDLHGRDKLNAALEMAAQLLKDQGINVDSYEMKMLIEAAVGEFNSNFITLDPVEAVKLYDGPQQSDNT